ncbi:MAG: S41 family peptidase [Erysipelotrichaceae bacterium]|nr:S41 family peptidase [Erysipelotrichaceae bacterium]
MQKLNNKNFYRLMTILIFIIGLLIGSCGSYLLFFAKQPKEQVDVNVFNEISSLITHHWIDTTESKESIDSRMISGMINGLGDPHTTYMSANEVNDFMESINGDYQGIGVAFSIVEEGAFVTRVYRNTPAAASGIMIGDIITKANQTSLKGKNSDQIKESIRGKEKTYVNLTILRGHKTLKMKIKRAALDTDVFYEIRKKGDNSFGYLEITTFGINTGNQVEEALKLFTEKNIKTIVIDLRNNGGGYLMAANEILNYFCKEGEVLFSLTDGDGNTVTYKDQTDTQYSFDRGYILINGNTASASEMVGAALSELYNYQLIGTRSYGKGTAQTQATLSDSSVIKYTYAKWYTPKGNNVNGVGLKPNIEVAPNDITSLAIGSVDKNYTYDSVDDNVAVMQKMLMLLGYKVDRTDGYFSKKTEAALKAFQEDHSLTVDGIYGKYSFQHLLAEVSVYLSKQDHDAQYQTVLNLIDKG